MSHLKLVFCCTSFLSEPWSIPLSIKASCCAPVQEGLRGCLCKNHPLNFAPKIILPETLVTERLHQGLNKNRFGLNGNGFPGGGGLGAIKYRLGQRPSQRLQKYKIGIFRGAVKYLIRIIQQWILAKFTHQLLQFSERLTRFLLIHVARWNQAHYSILSIAVERWPEMALL